MIPVFVKPAYAHGKSDVELAALVSRIDGKEKARQNLFVGLGVTSRQVRQKDGQVEKELNLNFDQLEPNVWRSDTNLTVENHRQVKFVMMCDGPFSFNATAPTADQFSIESRTVDDITIDYKEMHGRVLPYLIVEDYANGRVSTSEILEVRDAKLDRDYYTAESLGLKTPRRPIPRWQIWLGLAIVCFAAGILFKSRTRRSRAS